MLPIDAIENRFDCCLTSAAFSLSPSTKESGMLLKSVMYRLVEGWLV